ncbi:EGF-like domain protein, partial [Teladorsagia circumcincta]
EAEAYKRPCGEAWRERKDATTDGPTLTTLLTVDGPTLTTLLTDVVGHQRVQRRSVRGRIHPIPPSLVAWSFVVQRLKTLTFRCRLFSTPRSPSAAFWIRHRRNRDLLELRNAFGGGVGSVSRGEHRPLKDAKSICKLDTCLNGGTCTTTNNIVYKCQCTPEYIGSRCQNKNPCLSKTCLNNGTCEPIFDGADFRCNCGPYYQQEYCGWSKLVWTESPVLEGCFATDPILEDSNYYKKFTQPTPMSVTNCKNVLQSQIPTYTMFTLSGDNCYLSNSSHLNATQYTMDSAGCKTKCKSSTEVCADGTTRAIVYTHDTAEFDTNACEDNKSLCNADIGQGICVDMATVNNGYICKCNPSYKGNECETGKLLIHKMAVRRPVHLPVFRKARSLHYKLLLRKQRMRLRQNSMDLPLRMSHINKCKYGNDCVNGTCKPIIDGTIPGSTCTCIAGYEGARCDQDKNDCVPYTAPDGKVYENRCKTRDNKAICVDGFDAFTCDCSPQWVGDFCDLNALLRDVLISIYGRLDLEMLPMLEDLLKNPSQIKDMVPFIVGLQEGESRTNTSWDYSDLFHWAAFEEKPLVLERDLHKWNDVVLGNCFTFNHRSSELDYKMRSSGIQGGLQVLMSVGSTEYAPWFDTAAILVFVHNKNEYVFSESVRYSAQPDGETLIQVRDTKYTRLAGRYGVCVKDPSEVNAYYYDGMYTTDPIRCMDSTIENCTLLAQDDVLITITLPRLEYQVFEEVPNMDLNRFISNLGGLLGVLMG